MPQVIRDIGLGETLGTSFGQGLAGLLQSKLGNLAQRNVAKQQASGLQTLLGIPEQEAAAISFLDPRIQLEVIKQKLQAPSQTAFAQALSGLLGGEVQPTAGIGPQAEIAGVLGPMQQPAGFNAQQAAQLAQLQLKKQAMQQRESEFERRHEQAIERQRLAKQIRKEERGYAQAVKELGESRITVKRANESIRANKDVLRLLDTGKVQAGPIYAMAKKIGTMTGTEAEKWGLSRETQLVDKILSAEPIRSLATIPGQAARLSKVFDTIRDMTPQLLNSEAGMRYLAKVRMADAKALRDFEIAKSKMIRAYERADKLIPADIDEKVRKKIQPQLDKDYAVVERLVGQARGITAKKLNIGSVIESLPDPKLNAGAELQDTETGITYVSNGTSWVPKT